MVLAAVEHGPPLSFETPFISLIILLLVVLTLPPLFERIKLPGLVGLLVAGVLLGKGGLGVLNADTETMVLVTDIGKIYLMFVIGLEIDLTKFHQTRNRSISLGILIFITSLTTGVLVGRWFGFSWNTSLLMGAIFAPHTLLAYPIVNHLGVLGNEAITVTIGATIFTDVLGLLLLAIAVSIHSGDFSLFSLVAQVLSLVIYAATLLFGLDWAGKWYFRRTGDEQGNQFTFVLLAVFLAAIGAQLINVERIVGAFLAGLAVNDVLGDSPVKEKVEFIGSTLFIPFFFVGVGLLVELPAFISSLTTYIGMTLAMVMGVVLGKLVGFGAAKWLYRYSWNQALTMWSLCLPHVAAPLAAAIVAHRIDLINDAVFNSVIVLMVVTAIAGPIATKQFASQLRVSSESASTDPENSFHVTDWNASNPPQRLSAGTQPFTIVIPILDRRADQHLVETAVLLAHHEAGQIVPLAIAPSYAHMDDPILVNTLQKQQAMVQTASDTSQTLSVKAIPVVRIADDEATGISYTAREHNANLVVMGWHEDATGLRARLFGTTLTSVFWASHCPVAAMRLQAEPANIHRILVPVRDLMPKTIHTVRFAQLFADAHHAAVTLIHVSDRRTPQAQTTEFQADLEAIVAYNGPQTVDQIKIITHDDVAEAILQLAKTFDLVILRSMRRRTAGGLMVSDVTTQLLRELTCSIVLFGEPHL
ncbi:MAG: universal stress protein [Cyanothece sp. SIO2G6]|nr:universal stress protein [Cyanothece sp. SIO2G6]